MIGHIRGTLLEFKPPQLLIEVNGIGYEIDCPMSTFDRLPAIGDALLLHTHFVVREDAHQLFGFLTRSERSLFRTLIKVNGVGPRLGLTILSSIEPNEFVRCVVNQDSAALIHIQGIGKKTAERLIIEMRDKLTDWEFLDLNKNSEKPNTATKQSTRYSILQDAISALIALGYKPTEASRLVAKCDDGNRTSEELIRLCLREKML